MVTFLDPGFHETKQEEFDGDIEDRHTSLKDIKKLVYTMWVGKIINELEEVLGVEWMVVAQLSIIAYHCPLIPGVTEICPSRSLDTSKLLVNALDGENSSQQSNKNCWPRKLTNTL